MENYDEVRNRLGATQENCILLINAQNFLDSPLFSCRDTIFNGVPELEDSAALVAMLGQLQTDRVNFASQTVDNCIERIRLSIFIVDLQNEVAIRMPDADTHSGKRKDIEKAAKLLQEAEQKTDSLAQGNHLPQRISRNLSDFFESAHSTLASAYHGHTSDEMMEIDDDTTLLNTLFLKRVVMLGHSIDAAQIKMYEVKEMQTATLQIERAIQKKIIPDDLTARTTVEGFRVLCRRMLNQVSQGLDQADKFVEGLDGMLKTDSKGFVSVQRYVPVPLDMLP